MTDGDRGQLILIAGFALAVAFVALALVLNTAIFTGSLSTRGENAPASDALVYRHSWQEDVGEFLRVANWQYADDDYGKLQANVSAAVEDRSRLGARLLAKRGRTTNATVRTSVEGTRIVHNDSTQDFKSADGDDTWTVAKGIDSTRDFDVFVTNAPVEFNVSVHETTGSDDWYVLISRDGGQAEVEVYNETADEPYTCRHSYSGSFWVNITEGTLAGSECNALQWASNVDDTYDIEYVNASTVEGTYSLVVDDPPTQARSAAGNYNDVGSPTTDKALYSVTVEFVYETPRLYYRTDLRVAPGEPDD